MLLIGLRPATGCTRFAINQRRTPPNTKTACGREWAPLSTRRLGSLLMDAHRSEPPPSLVKAVFLIVACPRASLFLGGRGRELPAG